MKFIFTLLISSFSITILAFNSNCETAYQEASYGYQHTKKALQANNKEQLLQYTEKALEAITRSKSYLQNCGCNDADNSSFDAVENLNKGLSKSTYEEIRFYVKKAKNFSQRIIISLDSCGENDIEATDSSGEENDLLAQERALMEQQKALEAQQIKLKEQLAEKKKMKEALALEKKAKLEKQKVLQLSAEKALQEIENSIQKMSRSLSCVNTSPNYGTFTKTIQELNSETLAATKRFYAQKAIEMSQYLSNLMEGCK